MSQEEELKRIADALTQIARVYSAPAAYGRELADSLSQILGRTQVSLPAVPTPQMGVGPAIVAVEVRLSPEEKEEICQLALADIEEQMAEFKGFISQALFMAGPTPI